MLKLDTPAPLKDQVQSYTTGYNVSGIVLALAAAFFWLSDQGHGDTGGGIASLGWMLILLCIAMNTLVWIVVRLQATKKRQALKDLQFKFVAGVSQEELFSRLHAALEKFGGVFQMGHSPDGHVCIQKGGILYDIKTAEDSFRIVWRQPAGKSSFNLQEYRSYKRTLSSMAIIAYWLQKEFAVESDPE